MYKLFTKFVKISLLSLRNTDADLKILCFAVVAKTRNERNDYGTSGMTMEDCGTPCEDVQMSMRVFF